MIPSFSITDITPKGRKFLCSFDVDEFPAETEPPMLWIARVFVPHDQRGKGYGSKMLKKFCEWCDENQKAAILAINAYGPLDEKALEEWYARYGFVKRDDGAMVRQPKKL